MVELNSTKEIDQFGGNLELDLMKINGFVQVPVTNNVGFLFGGRINHTDPFDSPLSAQSQNYENALQGESDATRNEQLRTAPEFNFYDVNGKVNVDLGNNHQLTLNAIGSKDDYLRNYELEYFTKWRDSPSRLRTREFFNNSEEWRNKGYSLQYNYGWRDYSNIDVRLYYSSFTNESEITSVIARAINSFPVPDSPVINTVALDEAAESIVR